MDCIFCRIIAGEIPAQKVLETRDLIVIKDIAPKAPIHYLIIPKKHFKDVRDFDADDLMLGKEIFGVAQQLSKLINNGDFRLVMSNGYDVGQRVFHAHVHFLAGTVIAE
jgi:histidine triad (HIT) family protein